MMTLAAHSSRDRHHCSSHRRRRRLSSRAADDLDGRNAYDVLGVSETSTFEEIKASFRRLAKETHPDVTPDGDAGASRRFLLILAAYEILSDSQRRADYDTYLLSQRNMVEKKSGLGGFVFTYHPHVSITKQTEVVEWLEWYRLTINDIVSHKRFASGDGFLDVLEKEFYSAICAAYYGPLIESLQFLPDRFEAEERSSHETPEVLHLVSGRDLFGFVNLVKRFPQLSDIQCEKLASPIPVNVEKLESVELSFSSMGLTTIKIGETQEKLVHSHHCHVSDAYDDLELHLCGKMVATASRSAPVNFSNDNPELDFQDTIHVFLQVSDERPHASKKISPDSCFPSTARSKILLGTIKGLGTSPEEGSCFVYDRHGKETHVILKHRTLLVRHMHWFQTENEVAICECKCSRARLPPSKFWLFEPRCGMHDVGGWYIETFGPAKSGRTTPSQRQWDGTMQHDEKRLHPAMYLMALSYRTLDIESAKGRKYYLRDVIRPTLSNILHWCKKLI